MTNLQHEYSRRSQRIVGQGTEAVTYNWLAELTVSEYWDSGRD